MTSYLFTFIVYTTAMIGMIFLALFVYKKCAVNNSHVSSSKFLEVEDCVNLGVRKQLYVVRAGDEKFLIASDAERTTFLSKLNGEKIENVLPRLDVPRNFDYDLQNLYSAESGYVKKNASEVLRNIISTGERS